MDLPVSFSCRWIGFGWPIWAQSPAVTLKHNVTEAASVSDANNRTSALQEKRKKTTLTLPYSDSPIARKGRPKQGQMLPVKRAAVQTRPSNHLLSFSSLPLLCRSHHSWRTSSVVGGANVTRRAWPHRYHTSLAKTH